MYTRVPTCGIVFVKPSCGVMLCGWIYRGVKLLYFGAMSAFVVIKGGKFSFVVSPTATICAMKTGST